MSTLIHRDLWSLLLAGFLLLASGCSKSNSPAAATTPPQVQKEGAPASGQMEGAPNEPGESAAEAPSGDSDSDESDPSYDADGDGDDDESPVEEDEEDGEYE